MTQLVQCVVMPHLEDWVPVMVDPDLPPLPCRAGKLELNHGETIVVDTPDGKFLGKVLDENLFHAHGARLFASRFDFLTLADVGSERNHLAAVGILQPLENDGGIETAGIGQYNFFYI